MSVRSELDRYSEFRNAMSACFSALQLAEAVPDVCRLAAMPLDGVL
jgi:hypothetical protein